ncbi:maleylacetoacetate isomerase [Gulbenkiania indica]|uniref:Maleylacetoacetate isomerase n=1 Tax=Gulbenkiania indica TaxID=375574 RepID=A0A0K6H899_9NEIS|nr:maleylacetoacetate isomerase [Gulbenkiania indica]CUA87065.1 maleylacetoacetate isomerase [Gulbenkiania indica]
MNKPAGRVLHGYFRSSAAYRVRIALAWKGLAYRQAPVSLIKGEQQADGYRRLNPQGLVPALEDGGRVLTQSLAICEYLEEAYPDTPRLLPDDVVARAEVRALAQQIACDLHPLNNLRVLRYLVEVLGTDDAQKQRWYAHWTQEGLAAFESTLARTAGMYCVGDTVSLADVCLVPQVFNARRFDVDLAPYPRLQAVAGRLEALPAFEAAHPARQPDAA